MDRCWSYFELNDRVDRLTHVMLSLKVARGDRIAVLSENRHEYVELYLTAAKLGAIIACQNWRQSATELSIAWASVERSWPLFPNGI